MGLASRRLPGRQLAVEQVTFFYPEPGVRP